MDKEPENVSTNLDFWRIAYTLKMLDDAIKEEEEKKKGESKDNKEE